MAIRKSAWDLYKTFTPYELKRLRGFGTVINLMTVRKLAFVHGIAIKVHAYPASIPRIFQILGHFVPCENLAQSHVLFRKEDREMASVMQAEG